MSIPNSGVGPRTSPGPHPAGGCPFMNKRALLSLRGHQTPSLPDPAPLFRRDPSLDREHRELELPEGAASAAPTASGLCTLSPVLAEMEEQVFPINRGLSISGGCRSLRAIHWPRSLLPAEVPGAAAPEAAASPAPRPPFPRGPWCAGNAPTAASWGSAGCGSPRQG